MTSASILARCTKYSTFSILLASSDSKVAQFNVGASVGVSVGTGVGESVGIGVGASVKTGGGA
jgi:hypothetical protein